MAVGSLLICASTAVQAQQPSEGKASAQGQRGQLSESDYRFLEKAARGGMEEVELGQLAEQKGANQAVRTFGQRMVTDHNKLNNELKKIAAQKGATVAMSLSHHENSMVQHLQTATGTAFDRDYVKGMVKDHRKDLKEFQDAARKLQDPDLRAAALKAVPILQEHLTMAESLETTVKNEK
jgi:putative membrane protein